MKISLFDINHLNTMIRENKAEKNNVVNEQETIQNNIECRYRRPTPSFYSVKIVVGSLMLHGYCY